MKIAVFWFRRDLRLEDNSALYQALHCGMPVLPIFIFDANILEELPGDDARVSFIYSTLRSIHDRLRRTGASLKVLTGEPVRVWEELLTEYEVAQVYFNKDYEPYALARDGQVKRLLENKGIDVYAFKDQVIFEEGEIVKNDSKPYTIYTPYKRRWLENFDPEKADPLPSPDLSRFYRHDLAFPSLAEIGFSESPIRVKEYDLSRLDEYPKLRDIPAEDATSCLGPHLRFGTVSIRRVIRQLNPEHEVFLGELIWREFFMQILWHFPEVVNQNFKPGYNGIIWRNDDREFERWCHGRTGYPMVDAGMRQLNKTGYMHNRVRMVAAGFLCKHLLIDWAWGEAYFAEKLLDYELSSNNGNWQWAAGTGCDAAPYFRVFNPFEQLKKFDREEIYIRRWIPEYGKKDYPEPMIEHRIARTRALERYRKGLLAKLNKG
ncbi:MAG: deoxyribodipyrimidine photo-lyase [Bacteroidales bacterium]|nr:deoxyribodipyrimidine photo-lyase [Bacteroidales bacterium]